MLEEWHRPGGKPRISRHVTFSHKVQCIQKFKTKGLHIEDPSELLCSYTACLYSDAYCHQNSHRVVNRMLGVGCSGSFASVCGLALLLKHSKTASGSTLIWRRLVCTLPSLLWVFSRDWGKAEFVHSGWLSTDKCPLAPGRLRTGLLPPKKGDSTEKEMIWAA